MDNLDVRLVSLLNEALLTFMYRGALVSCNVNILVYFNKLANNFINHSINFLENLRILRVTVLLYDLFVSRLLMYCKALK